VLASGPLSVTFPTLSETCSYATGLQFNFPEQFLTTDAYNQRGISKVTYTTASLPSQMLTTKPSAMHFAVVGLDNRKLLVMGPWEDQFF